MGLSVPALVLALAGSALGADTLTPVASTPVKTFGKTTLIGNAPATQKVSLVVGLKMTNLAGLEAFASDVNNPRSLRYHQYLTPAQVGARFGAPSANVGKVATYLQKYFTKVTPMANGTAVLVDGTVSQVKSAFGSQIGLYKGTTADLPVGSPNFYVNLTAPKMPKSVADLVTGVTGLENFYRCKPHTAYVTPAQARTLYGVDSTYDSGYKGAGVTVGISNFDGFRRSNLPLFYSSTNLPTPTGGVGSNVRIVAVSGGTGESDDAEGEGDLDIQMVLAMAPLCNLVIYDAPNSVANSLYVLQKQAQDNAVDIVSESYGDPAYSGTFSILAQKHAVHAAMSAQGITYLVSSGDDGTYPPIVENPTSQGEVSYSGNVIDPEVLVVGGTVATIDSQGNRLAEDGWVGSGGGWIAYRNNGFDFNVRPDWQKNIAIPNDTTHDYRLYPDVALHAAGSNDDATQDYYSAYTYVYNGKLSGVSGTSASSPLFAGQLAIMLQRLKAEDQIDASEFGVARLGHIQEALYGFAADSTFATTFTDILTGSNGSLPDSTVSTATQGWDFVTGLGAPILSQLYTNYTSLASDIVVDTAATADIYTASAPTITLGTSPQGDAGNLTSTDAITYSVLSIKQSGVGQVAAATFDFTLQSDPTNRRSSGLRLSLMSDRLTTDFVYLYNYTTNGYDLVKTVPATGAMSSLISLSLDESKYVQNNQVKVLARALKPARLGNVPFRLTVDQATVVERVKANS